MAGPIEGRAAWRKGAEAKRMRDASLALLEDIATYGYAGYRHPLEGPGDMGKTLGWEYEKVDPKERIAAAKELLDRTDGKPRQEITGEDGGVIRIEATDERRRLEELRARYPELLAVPGNDEGEHEDA